MAPSNFVLSRLFAVTLKPSLCLCVNIVHETTCTSGDRVLTLVEHGSQILVISYTYYYE